MEKVFEINEWEYSKFEKLLVLSGLQYKIDEQAANYRYYHVYFKKSNLHRFEQIRSIMKPWQGGLVRDLLIETNCL